MLAAPSPCNADGYQYDECSTLAPDMIGDSLSATLYGVRATLIFTAPLYIITIGDLEL
jgi:hypothetical protein